MARPLALCVALALLALGRCSLAGTPAYECAPNTEQVCVREAGGIRRLSSVGSNAPHGLMTSPRLYYHGHFSVKMKFQGGYTGGVLSAFYLIDTSTQVNTDPNHAEIDMEFYGGRNPGDIMLGMNVFAGGKHNLVEFKLPFDASKAFHEYAIMWNSFSIVWLVDGTPLRVLNRRADQPWPDKSLQPTLSVWDTSSWTALKADYQRGPISSWVYGMTNTGCPATSSLEKVACPKDASLPWNRVLSPQELKAYVKMQKTFMIKDFGWKS